MAKKQNAAELLLFIKEKFQPGQAFTGKTLKKIYLDESLNVTYFMDQLTKKGEIIQIKRNLWSLPGTLEEMSTILMPLYISRIERGVLDVIFKMELMSENGSSRFGLDKLKNLLSEAENSLLVDLIPKLKSVGIISCMGNGSQGKVLEIKEDLFLKYITEPELIKEISLTDLEIDQRIKRFISEEERKERRSDEITEELTAKEDLLLTCLTEIERLSKNKESLEKEILALTKEFRNIESLTGSNESEKQFVKLMSSMDPEKRRTIFKKLLA